MRNRPIDEDALPVMVPRSDKVLGPVSPERLQRLREHLMTITGAMKKPLTAAKLQSEPNGFPAHVARTACSLCRGWCCTNGADDAFLEERTMARVHQAGLAADEDMLLGRYLELVPEVGYEGSCIFHGRQGCTLDRSLRSDVCNSYFCGGLQSYLTGGETSASTVIFAGEGKQMRSSPVLTPKQVVAKKAARPG